MCSCVEQERFYEDFPAHEMEAAYNFATPSTMKPTQVECAKGSLNQICPHTTIRYGFSSLYIYLSLFDLSSLIHSSLLYVTSFLLSSSLLYVTSILSFSFSLAIYIQELHFEYPHNTHTITHSHVNTLARPHTQHILSLANLVNSRCIGFNESLPLPYVCQTRNPNSKQLIIHQICIL